MKKIVGQVFGPYNNGNSYGMVSEIDDYDYSGNPTATGTAGNIRKTKFALGILLPDMKEVEVFVMKEGKNGETLSRIYTGADREQIIEKLVAAIDCNKI